VSRDERVRSGLATLPADRGRALLERWERASAAPTWDDPGWWIHGDLHPGNLVVDGPALSGIIDWGDLAAGDPATDLSVAWTACDRDGRRTLRDLLQPTEAEWLRAEGNALAHGVACVATLGADERVRAIGRATLSEILGD
jgi:aminoglycoside phosphotransferase (APT) family kinase protein